MTCIGIVAGSIGCCSRQHVDFNLPSNSIDCKRIENIEISIGALDKTIQSNHETIIKLDQVVQSNNKTINTINDFINELMEKCEEINVYPTSLTLTLSDNKNKNCFTVITRGHINRAVSSNNDIVEIVGKTIQVDENKWEIYIKGRMVGNAVVTVVNKLGKTRDVKVNVVDSSLEVTKIAGKWIDEDKSVTIEKWEKKKILIKSNLKPRICNEDEVKEKLQKLVFHNISKSENMWESTIIVNEHFNKTEPISLKFCNGVSNDVKEEITVNVKQ